MIQRKQRPAQFPKDAGFSLLELAIALIIIGLLAATVLKGKDLIESARLNAVLGQIKEYQLAITSFHLKYGALPGDFEHAKDLIDSSLTNGKGDGKIEGSGFESESLHFWAHLAKGDFLSSDSGSVPTSGEASFSKGAPASKLGGGFTVIHEDDKHWLVLGEKNGTAGNGALLTPQQAKTLAQKLGVSDPRTGSVRVKNGHGLSGGNTCINEGGSFNLTHNSKACVMYFQFPI